MNLSVTNQRPTQATKPREALTEGATAPRTPPTPPYRRTDHSPHPPHVQQTRHSTVTAVQRDTGRMIRPISVERLWYRYRYRDDSSSAESPALFVSPQSESPFNALPNFCLAHLAYACATQPYPSRGGLTSTKKPWRTMRSPPRMRASTGLGVIDRQAAVQGWEKA